MHHRKKKQQKTAYLFPGQGSQWVGMGQDLYQTFPSARKLFDQADDILKFPLTQLCFQGPDAELKRTVNAQPAILTMSLACLSAIRETEMEARLGLPHFVAGHSMGEYTGLVAAGAMDFPAALCLVRERGRLMEEAGLKSPGGMLALLGLELATIEEICQASGAEIANINCPGQVVISGSPEALARARELVREQRGKAIPLEVSGAFHSSRMRRAMRKLTHLVAALKFHRPAIPIIANTTAQPVTSVRGVRQELCAQLCQCVKWQNSVEYMSQRGVETFVEIGPGEALGGMVRRTRPQAQVLSIKDVSSLTQVSQHG